MNRFVPPPAVRRPTLTVATAAAVVVGCALRADAQSPVDDTRGHLVLAAGLDAFLRDGSESTPSPALHAGYEFGGGVLGRLQSGSRVGLRLGADYTTKRYGATTVRINGEPAGTVDRSGRSQVFGAVLLATYGLTEGPVRLYVLGGGGVYGLIGVRREPSSPFAAADTTRTTRVSPALSGGVGVGGRVGGVGVFGEARVTYLSNGVGGSRPGVRGVVVPLVLGVRF